MMGLTKSSLFPQSLVFRNSLLFTCYKVTCKFSFYSGSKVEVRMLAKLPGAALV